jgi:hypothetical protein
MGQRAQAIERIAKLLPSLQGNQPVYEALLRFFDDDALIAADLADLDTFLQGECLYRVIRTAGPTLRACAIDLVDNHPESTAAKGMLRLYETSERFSWNDCEAAENIVGNALTLDIYAWSPDGFTLRNDGAPGPCALLAIIAFD